MANYAVNVNNLYKKYGNKMVLNDFNWKVPAGEIHALVGNAGSGKTTLLNILAGIIRPTNGSCKIFSYRLGSLEAKKVIGYVPAQPAFYSSLNLVDYLVYMGMISGLNQTVAISRAKTLLKRIDLYSFRWKKPVDLTQGMKIKIALAQSLLAEPLLLLLDEPVSGLEPVAKMSILELLKGLAGEEEVTVVITAEHWADVASIVDKITILNQGRVLLSADTPVVKSIFEQGVFALDTTDNSKTFDVLKRMSYLQQITRTKQGSLLVITEEIERFRKDLPGVIYKLDQELLTFEQIELTEENLSNYLFRPEGV
ncbi:MAG TPA: ABC transporter ATP-binding protein [Peptococcaceae bacterium]|nr:ABC transporter ATP-binding protein [Peptococcaceae bacterium]